MILNSCPSQSIQLFCFHFASCRLLPLFLTLLYRCIRHPVLQFTFPLRCSPFRSILQLKIASMCNNGSHCFYYPNFVCSLFVYKDHHSFNCSHGFTSLRGLVWSSDQRVIGPSRSTSLIKILTVTDV